MAHGTVNGAPMDTDANLGGASPSDQLLPTQKAVKTYVDANGGGVSAHSGLTALAWSASGHTGTASTIPAFTSGGAATEIAAGSEGQVLRWVSGAPVWGAMLVVSVLGRGDIVIEGRTVLDHATTTVTVGIL